MTEWLNSISPADWLNAAVNATGIFVAFVAGALLGPWLNAKRARWEAKEQVLRTLLNTRVDIGHPDFSAAISVIPLEFNNSKVVRSAYARYLTATNRQANNDAEKLSLQIEISNRLDDLITCISSDIWLDITGHEGSKYLSDAYVIRNHTQEQSWVALIRIANALERAETRASLALASPSTGPPPEADCQQQAPDTGPARTTGRPEEPEERPGN
jgi:hypothetical protein